MKRNPKPPITMAICAWCKKVGWKKGKSPQAEREFLIADSPFTVKDFKSHSFCVKCAAEFRKTMPTGKNPAASPPSWVRDKAKWKEAMGLAQVSYGHKIGSREARSLYAVVVAIYKDLGGRIRRKVKRNPSEKEWRAVIDLFDEFHEFEPDSTIVFKVNSLKIPGVLVKLGDLHEVTYKSNKFDRRSRLYAHKFGRSKPILAADKDGRLFIIGGGYKITNRGIEG